jgi:signal transduction histidine kinase
MNSAPSNKKTNVFAANKQSFYLAVGLLAGTIILGFLGVVFSSWIFPLAGSVFAVGAIFLIYDLILKVGEASFGVDLERNQLKSIISTMDDALLVYDQNFKVLFLNGAAEKLFGVKNVDFSGHQVDPKLAENPSLRRLAQVVFPSLAPSMITRSPAGRYPQIVDLSFDDPYLELRTYTSPILDDGGNLLGFMKIIRDRTREVSLSKEKTEFVTVTSHQLRTPLTHVVWGLETITKDPSISPELAALAQNAYGAAIQLREIVEDLLNISRIEEGRFGYQFQKTNLFTFIEGILQSAATSARQLGIKVLFDRPTEALPEVMVDTQKLSMVLSNLVDNAIRYNVKNGEVVVSVKKLQSPYVEISVRDTGIGIPPEEVQKLFVKFFRASNALKFATEGSGLGLYIAQNIVRAHGGSMRVESELGRGSIFSFTLPTDYSLIPPKEVPLEY